MLLNKKYFLIIISIISFFGCKKNNLLTNGIYNIETSVDTVLFDTLFTTIGSTTKRIKIYNNNEGMINISKISLIGGENSPFRINVDGESGTQFHDLTINTADSIFIFIEVTIDPNGSNLPLVVEDEIQFETNGNIKKVILNAWGQDAYFHVNEIVQGVWTNDKPHVIYGIVAVGYPNLDSNLTLNIDPGTKIHGHANSVFYVYKSSINVNGNLNDPVIFQQDRMEDYLLYPSDSVPGQWRGILLSSPLNSIFNHTLIKNAIIGVQIDTFATNNTVSLNKVKIHNSLYTNLLTQGANINATNCLFGNSNNYSAIVSIGGSVNFEHCTFGNYNPGYRNTPAFLFKDYYKSVNDQIYFRPFDFALFTNCIFDGNGTTEFICDTLGEDISNVITNVLFDHCSVRSEDTIQNYIFNSCFFNTENRFINPEEWVFELTDLSEVINLGKMSNVSDDILDLPRNAPNDLGCYEYQ